MQFPKEIIAFESPVGIVMYPWVFERNQEADDAGKYWFGLMLKFKKEMVEAGGDFNEEWLDMRRQFMKCAKLSFTSYDKDELKNLASPIRDGDKFDKENNRKKKEELFGHYYMSFKCGGVEEKNKDDMSGAPTIVDRNNGLKEITSRKDFYPGCEAMVSGTVFPYSNKGNEGVGVRLTNICKWNDGERIGGRPDAKDQFKKYAKDAPSKNNSDADDLL